MDEAQETREDRGAEGRRWRILVVVTALLIVGVGAGVWATRHRCGDPREIARTLAESPDAEARRQAVWCLYHHALGPEAAVSAAAQALSDPDAQVRMWAVRFLQWRTSSLPPEHVAALIPLLSDPDRWVSDAAARTLGHLKHEALPHLPAVIELLDRGPPNGRRSAAFLLGMLYAVAPKRVRVALPGLIRAATSDDRLLREKALWTLRELGPAAQPAIPTLIARLGDPDPQSIEASMAGETLGKIGAPALPALSRVLHESDDPRARLRVAQLLQFPRRFKRPAMADLLVVGLTDPDARVRQSSRIGLASLRAAADPVLLAWVRGGDAAERAAALKMLGHRPGAACGPDVQAALTQALTHARADVRDAARLGLARGRPFAQASPHLLRLLEDGHLPGLRAEAAYRLGKLGPRAVEALPALRRASGEPAAEVRIAAAFARFQIAPATGPEAARRVLGDLHADGQRRNALVALMQIAKAERRAGRALVWWAVPWVWARELALLIGASLLWFLLHARLPRFRPRTRLRRAAAALLVGGLPAAGWGGAVSVGLKAYWVDPCLPTHVGLTLLPFRWSAAASVAGLCLLAGLFVVVRKPRRPAEEEPARGSEPEPDPAPAHPQTAS